jgi:hypothetical protein
MEAAATATVGFCTTRAPAATVLQALPELAAST